MQNRSSDFVRYKSNVTSFAQNSTLMYKADIHRNYRNEE